METRLNTLLDGENPLYNGGAIILEYVPDSCTVLENIDDYL